jgi:hypothetical protein
MVVDVEVHEFALNLFCLSRVSKKNKEGEVENASRPEEAAI